MAKLFDLVTAQNIVDYWTEKNANAQPLLGETLFPTKRQFGTELSWIKGAKNQPVALRLSSYDAKAIRRDVQGLDKVNTEMPFFKESFYIDEKTRQQLNNFVNNNNPALAESILSNLYDQEADLINASDIALERMRMQVLTSGAITLSSNGQSYTYDYGVPASQKTTVTTSWSNASADIIGDIVAIKEAMAAKGVKITRAVCNSSVVTDFATNTALKNAIYVFAGGTVNVTSQAAIDYIFAQTGVKIYQYDNVYVDESNNAIKYVADNTIVFMPDGDLGNTYKGTTPEESDLMNSLNANVALVNDGVAVATHEIFDPVNVETKVSMVALPSFEMAGAIWILDTEA